MTIQNILDLTMISRENFYSYLNVLDIKTLNEIPSGFSNNIAWNIAHIISTTDALVYRLSGLDTNINDEFYMGYRKGTKPSDIMKSEDIDMLKYDIKSQIFNIQSDINIGKFKEFTIYTTSFNNTLNNYEDALLFNLTHEGIHLGYILNLLRFIKNS